VTGPHFAGRTPRCANTFAPWFETLFTVVSCSIHICNFSWNRKLRNT
jgi:hypothetical protein